MPGRTRRWVKGLALTALCIASAAHAEPEELIQTQAAIDQAQKKQQELQARQEALQQELQKLQEHLVVLAKYVQEGEAALTEIEKQLQALDGALQEKTHHLAQERKKLEILVQATLSLSRTPPEAMLLMPGDAMEAMKAARVLALASEDIRSEEQRIAHKLAEINTLKQETQAHHEALLARQVTLTKDRKALEKQMNERRQLLQQLGQQSENEAQKLAQLAKKAQNIKELLSNVQQERAQQPHPKKRSQAMGRKPLRSFEEAQGHVHPPIAGSVIQSFGAPESNNATSKGMVVKTRAEARVVNPYDGEIVFTGPFLAYGQMVIIRHSDDFHTLLAGLSKIDVEVGQFLLEGEPIGAMGEEESSRKLYIELRQHNQPIDPAEWISGLNKKH